MKDHFWLPLAAFGVSILVGGCAAHPRVRTAIAPPPPPATSVAAQPARLTPPAPDPVQILVATSERHFANGERELKLGHLDQARAEFDRALEVLLESPYGARSDSRIREHFDRLVDRINAHEMVALAQGDGFTEKKYEAASIDQLLEIATFEKPAATAPALQDTVRADLEASAHDIPIPLNQRVLSYVELFQGRLREFIQDGMQRGAPYLPMIQNVFRAEGLPLDLAYVPLIESAFKPNALSRAKAKGVWQFMKGTALEHGLKTDWYIDERSDPEKATQAAAKYLKKLHTVFDGDWHLALASYNGGPSRVQKALRRTGRDDFWSLTANASRVLPRETREYVPMILAAIIIARNPVQYGFNINILAAEPIAYDKVALPRAVDLRRVAEWTGASIDEIQALNPELRRWTTPVKYPDYEIKVPVGTAASLRQRLGEAAPDDFTALNWYTVRRGETLATIARKLKVARADLAEANNLATKSRVRPGQSLVIPRAPTTLLASRAERPAPADEVVSASRSLSGSAETPVAANGADRVRIVYRVKRGDTLFSIARLFETSVQALKSWNRLRGSRIAPGDRLFVYRSR
jgi:membrane-bound lytic murein transglycosylase D